MLPEHLFATAGTCDQINNNLNSSDIIFAKVDAQTLLGISKANDGNVFVGQNFRTHQMVLLHLKLQ